MRIFSIIIFLSFLIQSCKNDFEMDKGKLNPHEITMDIRDMFFSCDCARWIDSKTSDSLYNLNEDIQEKHCFYIEFANDELNFEESVQFGDTYQVTGQFYENVGYPEGYSSVQNPEPSRVFRINKYQKL